MKIAQGMTNVSIHCFARLSGRFFWALGIAMTVLGLGAIAPPPESPPTVASLKPISPSPHPSRLIAPLQQAQTLLQAEHLASIASLQSITFYTPTDTCDGFQTTTGVVAAEQAVDQVVRRLLGEQVPALQHFDFGGYRVLRQGRAITVDLRVAPTSRRQLVSLSICEQGALLGSLRQTLLQNPALAVETVRFTQRGQPLLR